MITWTENHTRAADLRMLNVGRNDTTINPLFRKHADSSYKKIRAQMEDKYLESLRTRLMKATNDCNHREQWKLTSLIKDYLKEDKINE